MTTRSPQPTAILLLAYGTPETPDDVLPYFTHIRGGRTPSAEAVEHLKRRYERVGGRTPLLDVTLQIARALETQLEADTGPYRVFVAMKHWHPFIGDVIPRVAAEGIRRVIAIVLAPHYSRMSVGAYEKAVADATQRLAVQLDVTFVEHWGMHPLFIALIAEHVREGFAAFGPQHSSAVMPLFSAHSLPVRIREWSDPYEDQLRESCAAAARHVGLAEWRFAWQSSGHSAEPWLGPDIGEYLETLRDEGVRRVLSVPIGFLCDHLEVLYDIDVEAQRRAAELGVTLRRIAMPNASPSLVATLAALVRDVERGALGIPLAAA
ncbi:MAG: ferrochelatase [Gemmatimonadaceae bacterium]